MARYRRFFVPGGTYFFTVCLAGRGGEAQFRLCRTGRPVDAPSAERAERRTDLLVRKVAALREAVQATRAERPFGIGAFVVLPDHLHCVWTLPEGDSDAPTLWGAVKGRQTIALSPASSIRLTNTIRLQFKDTRL